MFGKGREATLSEPTIGGRFSGSELHLRDSELERRRRTKGLRATKPGETVTQLTFQTHGSLVIAIILHTNRSGRFLSIPILRITANYVGKGEPLRLYRPSLPIASLGTISLPIGQRASPASFKWAHANGSPTIVTARPTAVMR